MMLKLFSFLLFHNLKYIMESVCINPHPSLWVSSQNSAAAFSQVQEAHCSNFEDFHDCSHMLLDVYHHIMILSCKLLFAPTFEENFT